MIAHIIHDKDGTINTVVLQGMELDGDLEIEMDDEGAVVTTVDLSEEFPGVAADRDTGSGHLRLLASDIRDRFRIDPKRRKLERLSQPRSL